MDTLVKFFGQAVEEFLKEFLKDFLEKSLNEFWKETLEYLENLSIQRNPLQNFQEEIVEEFSDRISSEILEKKKYME